MTESSPGEHPDDHAQTVEHAQSLDRALAESQRQERDERDADMARQQSADDRIVQALTQE